MARRYDTSCAWRFCKSCVRVALRALFFNGYSVLAREKFNLDRAVAPSKSVAKPRLDKRHGLTATSLPEGEGALSVLPRGEGLGMRVAAQSPSLQLRNFGSKPYATNSYTKAKRLEIEVLQTATYSRR